MATTKWPRCKCGHLAQDHNRERPDGNHGCDFGIGAPECGEVGCAHACKCVAYEPREG